MSKRVHNGVLYKEHTALKTLTCESTKILKEQYIGDPNGKYIKFYVNGDDEYVVELGDNEAPNADRTLVFQSSGNGQVMSEGTDGITDTADHGDGISLVHEVDEGVLTLKTLNTSGIAQVENSDTDGIVVHVGAQFTTFGIDDTIDVPDDTPTTLSGFSGISSDVLLIGTDSFTVSSAGVYMITARVAFTDVNDAGSRQLNILINGASKALTTQSGAGTDKEVTMSTSYVAFLEVDDTIEFSFAQTSGEALTISNISTQTQFSIVYLGRAHILV
jgi:hypothetical protein